MGLSWTLISSNLESLHFHLLQHLHRHLLGFFIFCFPDSLYYIGVLTSSIGVRVRRFFGFVLGLKGCWAGCRPRYCPMFNWRSVYGCAQIFWIRFFGRLSGRVSSEVLSDVQLVVCMGECAQIFWVFRVWTVDKIVTVSKNRLDDWETTHSHIVSNERTHFLSCCFSGVLAASQEGGKLCGGHGSQTGPQEKDFPCLSVFVGGNEDSMESLRSVSRSGGWESDTHQGWHWAKLRGKGFANVWNRWRMISGNVWPFTSTPDPSPHEIVPPFLRKIFDSARPHSNICSKENLQVMTLPMCFITFDPKKKYL